MSANYVNIAGGTVYNLTFNPATLNLQNNQFRLVCKTSGGAVTINLPAISFFGNGIDTKIFIEDADDMSATNNITVVCNAANTIANAPNYIINENGKKIEIFISSKTEFGVLGKGVGGGAGQDTLLGMDANGVYPIANSPSQVLTASGIAKVYGILQLQTQPISGNPSNLKTISFPDLRELIGGIDFVDDGTALLETLSFPQLEDNLISSIDIEYFASLNSITFPAIKKLLFKDPAGTFIIGYCDALTSFSLPLLTDIESTDNVSGVSVLVVAINNSVTSVSYPELVNIDKSAQAVITIGLMPNCTSFNLPKLKNGAFGLNKAGIVALQGLDILPSISLPEATNGISLAVELCPMLTSISVPKLITAAAFGVSDCAILPSFTVPLLTTASLFTTGGGVLVRLNPLLTNFSFPALVTSDMVRVEDNNTLTQALFPVLATVGYDAVWVENNDALTSLNFPLLMSIGGSYIVINNAVLATLTQPALTIITGGFVDIRNNPLLTSVSLSSLISAPTDVAIASNATLTTVVINMALTVPLGGNYNFQSNALTQACVDDILAKLDAGGLSGRNLILNLGTNATPSAAGLVSKGNLIGKGWTVTTN
jgi:hypothetical protein